MKITQIQTIDLSIPAGVAWKKKKKTKMLQRKINTFRHLIKE